ncbi:MAG TPA: glycosyltransferase family 39 protein, partial [Candidatus Binatia bacterium]|nr:glycosyltransferase family 39 protein [Candidatus Binatia bacterium]
MSELKQIEPERKALPVVERQRKVLDLCCYALLFLSIACFAGIRFHLRHVPLERDGGEYAYMGQLMLQGVPPYKLASNMKLPGTYAAYAVMMAVFGETPAGIHVGVIVVTSLSAIFLFLIGKRLYGPLTGSVAAASYVSFAARPGVLGIDGQATHFVVVMALAGIWLLLCAMPTEKTTSPENSRHFARVSLLFTSGLCFGLSFLMKQPGILFAVFAGAYWLYCQRKLPWRILLTGAAALIVGILTPYAITCLIMLKLGVFHNFWFWTWTYARQYAGLTDL